MSITSSKGFSFSQPPVNLPHQSYTKGHASVRGDSRMCILRSERPGHKNKEAPHKSGVLFCLCLLYTKDAEKTNSKPMLFEFERKNKGAKYSFRRQAETERCELVLTWYAVRDSLAFFLLYKKNQWIRQFLNWLMHSPLGCAYMIRISYNVHNEKQAPRKSEVLVSWYAVRDSNP